MTGYSREELIGQHFSVLSSSRRRWPLATTVGGARGRARRCPPRPPSPCAARTAARSRSTSGPSAWSSDGAFVRHPGRDPRHQRPGPPRDRAAPPGRRAGRRRGARPPRPRAPRLGHPGAVLDDHGHALGRAPARPRPGQRPRRSSGSCASSSARPWPRCARSSSSCGPGNLEQDGLVRALKTHTSALQGRLGLPIVVESDLDERLPLAVEETLYRIAQEALHNIVKHAKASQVWVGLHAVGGGGVRLRIQRRRPGLRPDAPSPTATSGWPGCAPASDRLGGTFQCTSQTGAGTTIEVTLGADDLERLRRAQRRHAGRAARCLPVHPRR